MKEIFAYVLGMMLTSAKRQDSSTYMLKKKLRKLRLEYFESYSSFYTVRIVLFIGGRVIDCFILILFRHSTTGPGQ